jgi:hypothetical protein
MDHFSKCGDIQAFIPSIKHPSLPCPLVAADITTFNPQYLSFEQPSLDDYKTMSIWNSPELPGFSDEEKRAFFSEVVYYPPPASLEEEDPTVTTGKTRKQKNGDYEAVP